MQGEARKQIVAPLWKWLRETIGAEDVCLYAWDPVLVRCLPFWAETGTRGWDIRVERALASLVDQVLTAAEGRRVDPVSADPILGPLAPERFRTLTLIPYLLGAEPLGVLVILNADREPLEVQRATLNLLAPPTLLALRCLWEVRQVTVQNQELQRSKGYLLALLKEIEHRQLVIEQLTQEVERTRGPLEGIFENAPVALISMDRSGTIQSANQPAADLFGHSKTEMMNRRIGDLLPRVLHAETEPLFQRALSGETVKLAETFWPGTGGTRVVMLTFYPFRDDRGEILGVVGRECFAPRMTFTLRDGRRVTGEYHGRELMWDFARDARELRRFLPGLPVAPARYDALVQAIARLDTAASVDEMLGLTLTPPPRG